MTFTHDTWDQVYSQLEKDFPDYDILGWYHSHPGFGVSFSEMDLFIQRNFFPSPTQFALVMDPLGGEKALCLNTPQGIRYIGKFWVEGREYRAFQGETESPDGSRPAAAPHIEESLGNIERRLSQVLHAVDKLSLGISRALAVMAALFLILVVSIAFYSIFFNRAERSQPPEVLQYVPVPVKIADKEALLGVGIVSWKIPPEVKAYFEQFGERREDTGKDWFRSFLDRIWDIFEKNWGQSPPAHSAGNDPPVEENESNILEREKRQ